LDLENEISLAGNELLDCTNHALALAVKRRYKRFQISARIPLLVLIFYKRVPLWVRTTLYGISPLSRSPGLKTTNPEQKNNRQQLDGNGIFGVSDELATRQAT
jgi:hypothetical protein